MIDDYAPAPRLSAWLNTVGKRRGATWVGARPMIWGPQGIGAVPEGIAAMVGYPTCDDNPFESMDWPLIDKDRAATMMAFAATRSLAYHSHIPPRRSDVADAREALDDLGDGAKLYTNGGWAMSADSFGWTPLTSATFDCGVIGYDRETAFIFWVEDED